MINNWNIALYTFSKYPTRHSLCNDSTYFSHSFLQRAPVFRLSSPVVPILSVSKSFRHTCLSATGTPRLLPVNAACVFELSTISTSWCELSSACRCFSAGVFLATMLVGLSGPPCIPPALAYSFHHHRATKSWSSAKPIKSAGKQWYMHLVAYNQHCNDVTWVSLCLKSPSNRLFVHQLV